MGGPEYSATVALVAQPAQPTPDDPGGRGPEFGKSSPIALVFLLLFFVAVALLVRSMNKHLRRVPESFDPPPAAAPPTATPPTAPPVADRPDGQPDQGTADQRDQH